MRINELVHFISRSNKQQENHLDLLQKPLSAFNRKNHLPRLRRVLPARTAVRSGGPAYRTGRPATPAGGLLEKRRRISYIKLILNSAQNSFPWKGKVASPVVILISMYLFCAKTEGLTHNN